MTQSLLTFPIADATGDRADLDRVVDFVELDAFFSSDSTSIVEDVGNYVKLSSSGEFNGLNEEITFGPENLISGIIGTIEHRQRMLETEYPFDLDVNGDVLTYRSSGDSLGPACYTISLILSNLRSLSPILREDGIHPSDTQVRTLRLYFQYFATAALAAEVGGDAWSFGFPRPDGTGFLSKLKEVWAALNDGSVAPQVGAPRTPKDDQVDVFAARTHRDRLPGFPLVVAQVATGKDARNKSLRGRLGVFKSRWFAAQPVTDLCPYMVIPFTVARDQFIDDVRVMGNVLHRLRLPRRVAEARRLDANGARVEGYQYLADVSDWVASYRRGALPER